MLGNGFRVAVAFLWVVGAAQAETYSVTTVEDFNALPTLNAGDEVVLQNGNYGALNKTLVSSIADDDTAMRNPVRVYAQTPGGVKITEPSTLILSGGGITLVDWISWLAAG